MKFYESVFNPDKKQQPKESELPTFLKSEVKQKPKQNQSKINDRSSRMRESVLLKNKQQENQDGWFKKLCACTQLDYYKDFFNVTNDDVKKRIGANLLFWQGGFFEPANQQFDFYGPFWIHTTVVFCLGAVHNMLQYQANPNQSYDFEIIGEGFFAMYALGFGLPVGIGFIMKALGVNCTIMQILCLYGYSVSVYIACILLCSFNVCLLHWILLGYGAASKMYFVFKNIHQGFEIPAAKKLMVTILIIIEGVLQFLIFKVRFIYCADQEIPIVGRKHMMGMGNEDSFVHYRQFQHEQTF